MSSREKPILTAIVQPRAATWSPRPLTAMSILATRRASGFCWPHALEDELLGPLARVDLRRIDVALRVYRQIVHPVELAGLAPVPAELAHDVAVLAQQRPDVIVLAVRVVEPGLRRVVRDVEFPDRSVTARRRRDDELLHECPVLLEDLDAVVHPVADVEEPVLRQARAVHRIAERLDADFTWRPTVGAPVPLVGAGLAVEDDH